MPRLPTPPVDGKGVGRAMRGPLAIPNISLAAASAAASPFSICISAEAGVGVSRLAPSRKRARHDIEAHGDTLASGSAESTVSRKRPAVGATPRPFVCKVPGCGKSFPKAFKLDRHSRTHDKQRPFPCLWPDCGKAFTRQDHLRRHQKSHTGERDKRCSIPGCQAAFISNQKLRRHILAHENGGKGFSCPEPGCSDRFRKSSQLKRHIREHRGLPPYQCPEDGCAEAFGSARELRRHCNMVHRPARYVCDAPDCGERFTRFVEMRRHAKKMHPEANWLSCPHCGLLFPSRQKLTEHKRHHERTHACTADNCGKVFATAYNLRAHVTAVHQGLRPFVCPIEGCGKAFSANGSRKRHLLNIHGKTTENVRALLASPAQSPEEDAKRRRDRLITSICGPTDSKC